MPPCKSTVQNYVAFYPTQNIHNWDEQSLPQTTQLEWKIRWSRIRWRERILLKKSTAFKLCLNIKCLNSAVWVRVIWISISKEQFHLMQGGEQIPLNKNFPPCSFAWSPAANFVNFVLLELLFYFRKSCWSHKDLTTKNSAGKVKETASTRR